MNLSELKREVEIEKADIRRTLADIADTQSEIAGRTLSSTARTALAAYIAQCYTGVENILKRILKYRAAALPSGADWHIALLKIFFDGKASVPALLDEELFGELSLMRRFRHVAIHQYGFRLDTESVAQNAQSVPMVVERFLSRVDAYLDSEKSSR